MFLATQTGVFRCRTTVRKSFTLADILVSSQNVVPEDAWVKQILVVMAYADMHAELIETAWNELDPATKADTIVYVVVTDGMDTPIYFQ